MGAFKFYEVIVCCLILPLTIQRRERFEISLIWVVGLETREQAHSCFFNP